MAEFISSLFAVLFTLGVLSYLVADNPVYRLVVHLFIGLSAGYAVVITWYTVLQPQLVAPLQAAAAGAPGPGVTLPLLGTALGLLLLLKTVRVGPRLGSLVVAYLVGIGAAVAVGGAISGTLLPQTGASFVSFLPAAGEGLLEAAFEGVFIVLGTVTTLGFFYYGARAEPGAPPDRPALIKPVAAVGQVFIGIALGVLYAGALAASLAVFAERTASLANFFGSFAGSP